MTHKYLSKLDADDVAYEVVARVADRIGTMGSYPVIHHDETGIVVQTEPHPVVFPWTTITRLEIRIQ